MQVLEAPLTIEQIKSMVEGKLSDFITVRVQVSLNDIIENDFEWFLDELSEKVTGSIGGLTDIVYKPVDVTEGAIIIEVSGDVADFLDEEY